MNATIVARHVGRVGHDLRASLLVLQVHCLIGNDGEEQWRINASIVSLMIEWCLE